MIDGRSNHKLQAKTGKVWVCEFVLNCISLRKKNFTEIVSSRVDNIINDTLFIINFKVFQMLEWIVIVLYEIKPYLSLYLVKSSTLRFFLAYITHLEEKNRQLKTNQKYMKHTGMR